MSDCGCQDKIEVDDFSPQCVLGIQNLTCWFNENASLFEWNYDAICVSGTQNSCNWCEYAYVLNGGATRIAKEKDNTLTLPCTTVTPTNFNGSISTNISGVHDIYQGRIYIMTQDCLSSIYANCIAEVTV